MVAEVKTMEIKKSQQLTKPTNTEAREVSLKGSQWIDFFGDIKAEFLKITWTSPEELTTYTKIVVGMTVFLGMGIYFMDLIIQFSLGVIDNLIRLIS